MTTTLVGAHDGCRPQLIFPAPCALPTCVANKRVRAAVRMRRSIAISQPGA